MTHGLGRIPAPDPRDANFPLTAAPTPPTTPTQRTFRYFRTGPILDQGPYPHCVEFAWKQFLFSSPIRTSPTQFNQHYPTPTIYNLSQQIDEWPGENYDGTSVRAGAKVLQRLGLITNYYWASTAEQIADFLLQHDGGTVVTGTIWTNRMFFPDKNGIIYPQGSIEGGHAYLLTGYNQKTGLFRITNSWGTHWGQSGRSWLQGEDLQRLLDQDGEAATAFQTPLQGANQ